MAPPPKHRQPIIDAAVTLFRRNGFAGTGLNDLVEASGAPKGSLYHYFPNGKASIAVAAVEEAGRRVVETLSDLSTGTGTSAELITAYARLLGRWMIKSGFRDGCPMTTVLLELAPADRAVSKAGHDAYATRIGFVRDRLIIEGVPEQRAQNLAVLCISALQGALIQSRVERSAKPLETVADELAHILNAANAGSTGVSGK